MIRTSASFIFLEAPKLFGELVELFCFAIVVFTSILQWQEQVEDEEEEDVVREDESEHRDREEADVREEDVIATVTLHTGVDSSTQKWDILEFPPTDLLYTAIKIEVVSIGLLFHVYIPTVITGVMISAVVRGLSTRLK